MALLKPYWFAFGAYTQYTEEKISEDEAQYVYKSGYKGILERSTALWFPNPMFGWVKAETVSSL